MKPVRLAARYTDGAVRREHGPRERRAASKVEHRFIPVAGERRVEALVRELAAERELALVFVRTKRGADRLVKRLGAHGIRATAMHGNKSQRQREQALARFESGDIDTLVATDVAARGIDVEGISHVINFDAPGDRDAYVHRVGRTARAGRAGVGITLVTVGEHHQVRQWASQLGIEHGLGGAREEHEGRPAPRAQRRSTRPPSRSRRPRPRRARV